MSNKIVQQQHTFRVQTKALLDLLPTLKAELYFAGCDEKSRLLQRIDQVYGELTQFQALQAEKLGSDSCDGDDPIHLLQQYEFSEPVYHSDGLGHIQVQESDPPYPLEALLQQVEERKEWDVCFLMFESQSKVWLLDFAEHLENTASYHTDCNIVISQILTDRSDLITLLQNADRWYWNNTNRHLIPALTKSVDALLSYHEPDVLQREIDTSILTGLKSRLDRLYMNEHKPKRTS